MSPGRAPIRILLVLALLLGCLLRAATADGATVRGIVTNPKGRAVAGAVVRLSAENGAARQTVSNCEGQFALETIAPGAYELSVTATDYQSLAKSVTVAAEGGDFQIQLNPVVVQTVVV